MEDINIPVSSHRGLIIDKSPEDYEFGASPLNEKRKVLVSDGQWNEYLPSHFELQRNSKFDSYGCVSYSHLNCKEILFKRLYNNDLDMDDRDLVVGSGTKPGRGNGQKTVADWARKNGNLKDKGDIPPGMTESEYYAWKRSEEDIGEASKFLELFETGYEWLPTCNFGQTYSSPEQLMEALLYSPIQVCVDGSYEYDENGYIGKLLNWNHCVSLIGYEKNKYWVIYDSESTQLLKFAWGYKFGYGMSHLLKKNFMQMYKKKNEAAIYFLNPKDNQLVAYADGVVTGGDMFKLIFGDYKYADIKTVDELPFPIAPYQMTTI